MLLRCVYLWGGRAREKTDPMRLLLVFARAYPGHSIVALACLCFAAVAEGIGLASVLPVLSVATATSGGLPGAAGGGGSKLVQWLDASLAWVGLPASFGLLCALIVVGMLGKAGFVLLAQRQVGYTVAHVATDLRLALLRALLTARWEYYIRQPAGRFANAFAAEASRAAQAYLHGVTIVALLIQALLYFFLAAIISWRVALVAMLVGLVIAAVLGRLVRSARQAGRRQTKLSKILLERLTDVLYVVKPLKAMARETLLGPLLEREIQRLDHALRREVWSKEALHALQEPLLIAALVAGVYLVLVCWQLSLDTVLMLVLLCERTLGSFNKVQKEYQRMAACESAFWSLRRTIDQAQTERELAHGAAVPTLRREIALRRVSFAYGEQRVLHDVSLRVPAGQCTVLVGPSGAGKTSAVDLIVGLVRPQEGDVWIDDLPLRAIDLQGWRRTIGYVPQETLLLHESVFMNVSLGDPALTAADVESALRTVGAWDFVAALPQGMYTVVGEHGARFSGGQRQRIAIARAVVHAPQLLILDEATAALDPDSEAVVCQTIQQLRGKMTILAVSHRPALAAVADVVYRFEGGRVKEVEPGRERLPRYVTALQGTRL